MLSSLHNSLIMHNSYLYMIAHMWNQSPAVTKSSTILAQFGARLNNVNFTGCQCMNCTQFYLFAFLHTLRLVNIPHYSTYTARAIIHRSPQRTYLPASTNDFHPFHQTKLHSTKPPLRTKKHLTKADINTPSTTNPPRLPNAKTDSETTFSGTTFHSARTSAPTSDTNSSA